MVNTDEIRSVAANARLDLSDEKVEALKDDLEAILDSFESLDDIDTEGVEPAFHPVELDEGTRPDEAKECLSQDEALQNAENTEAGYFKGPRSV